MPFSNGFNGDHKSLQTIVKTLEAKQYLIPGITINANTNVTVDGESAFFYTRSAATAAAGNLGAQITYASKGGKRIDVPMTSRFGIGAVIPHVNHSAVSADLVTDKVVQESMQAANLYNNAGLTAIKTAALAKTYTKGAVAYEALVDAVATFKKANKNVAMRPTAALVSPEFYAKLLVDARFVRSTSLGDAIVTEAIVGKAAGVWIVEAVDLTDVDFILVNAEGVVAPQNVRSLYVTDATQAGYPGGTLVAGEIGYGFKVVTDADDETLDQTVGAKGFYAAKFTEAA